MEEMTMKRFALCLLFLSGCSEGCGNTRSVDREFRDDKITLHRVGGGCVALFYTDEGDGSAAMAPVPCDADDDDEKRAERP